MLQPTSIIRFAALLFVSLQISIFAQPKNVKFQHIDVKDGLSNRNVNCIFQDSRGFIWIGTEAGLNRYDGYQFKHYYAFPGDDQSLTNSDINAIAEDSSGFLWIGTYNGLNRLDPFTGDVLRLKNGGVNLTNEQITDILLDSDNNIWVGTIDGLNCLQRLNHSDRYRVRHFRHDPQKPGSIFNNYIHAIYEDTSGDIYIGTNRWMNIYNKFENRMETVELIMINADGFKEVLDPFQSTCVYDFLEMPDGKVWFGLGSIYFSYIVPKERKAYCFISDKPNFGVYRNLVKENATAFWFSNSSQNSGLVFFDTQTNYLQHFRATSSNNSVLQTNIIDNLVRDRAGVLWMSLDAEKGIYKYDPREPVFQTIDLKSDENLGLQQTLGILETDDRKLWVASWGKLPDVFEYQPQQNAFYQSDYFQNSPVNINNTRAIQQDASGNLWFGGTFGLFEYHPKTGAWVDHSEKILEKPPFKTDGWEHSVQWILASSNGDLWISVFKLGVRRWHHDSKKVQHYYADEAPNSLPDDDVVYIFEDSQKNIWLGTINGLARYRSMTDDFQIYQNNPADSNSLSENYVTAIDESDDGNLWIATRGGGLNRLNPQTQKFQYITTQNGLPNNTIFGVIIDDSQNIWLSTARGLSRLEPQTGEIENFFEKDGLGNVEFNYWSFHKGNSGRLYFGAGTQLIYFHPDSLRGARDDSPMEITSFNVHNQSFDSAIRDSKAILNHSQNVLSFEFAALNFRESGFNRYEYKLEGLDDHWVDAFTHRNARYSGILPGDYVFRVRRSNPMLNHPNEAALHITILPPWWKTIWAYLGYAVFILSLLYVVRRYELNRQRLKLNLEMEHQQWEKLQELDRAKSRFFANISHEFRTPLSLILGPAEKLKTQFRSLDIKKEIDVIVRNGKRLLQLVNQLLDLSKLEFGKMQLKASPTSVVDLTRFIITAFESAAHNKNIELTFASEAVNAGDVYIDREKFEQIFANLLSNALKFTPKNGEITVSCSEIEPTANDPGYLKISIRDNGIGIGADHLPQIFERFYQVDDAENRAYEGTGIGLALTKELVELHHGKVEVSSELGVGTQFDIYFPIGNAHLSTDEVVNETVKQPNISADDPRLFYSEVMQNGGGVKINPKLAISKTERKSTLLLAEDNPDMRHYIRSCLQERFQIIEAENGRDALKIAKKVVPVVIISDVMMPLVDGFELCKRIKTNERISHIPVILLTAKAAHEDMLSGLEYGADDYLTKPFDVKELQLRVNNTIKQRQRLQKRFQQTVNIVPSEVTVTPIDKRFLEKAIKIVETHLSDPEFDTKQMALEMGVSRSLLHMKLKAITGFATREFIRNLRLKRAARLIERNFGNIAQIAYEVGFNSLSHFSKVFRIQFGKTPSEYALTITDDQK